MSDLKETKLRLLEQLAELPAVIKVRKGDNLGPVLGEIYVWQECAKYAKEKLDAAWKDAAAADAIDSDDVLREGSIGEERILTESNSFSVLVKLDTPRKAFSREKFITALAKRYKLDPHQLEKLAATCMTKSIPPLHKRVVEV